MISPLAPSPMNPDHMSELRDAVNDIPQRLCLNTRAHMVRGLVKAHDQLLARARVTTQELDAYRARCQIIASDISKKHTAERVMAYALANGWTGRERITPCGAECRANHKNGSRSICLSGAPYFPGTQLRWVGEFCERHAAATGMAPLDVIAAIGEMP